LNDIEEATSLQCPQAVNAKLDNLQRACQKKLSAANQHLNGWLLTCSSSLIDYSSGKVFVAIDVSAAN